MNKEHAIPEPKGEKLHGDKLESVVSRSADTAQDSLDEAAKSGASHIKSSTAVPSGDPGGGDDPMPSSTDGKFMP